MAKPMPARAYNVAVAMLEAEGCPTPRSTLDYMRRRVMPEHELARQRQAVWRALRAEQDERGRTLYTQDRVASWFGVTRSAVAEFEKRERDAAG